MLAAGLLRLPSRLGALTARLFPPRLRGILYWVSCVALIVLSLAALTLRHVVLPRVDAYRAEIAQALGNSLGLRVEIENIHARWDGLHPELALHGLKVFDKADRLALQLDAVRTQIAWSSFALADVRLYGLELSGIKLDLRRDSAGHIFVAGLEIGAPDTSGGVGDWILAQRGFVVRDAALTWSDEMRGGPPLELTDVHLRLENRSGRHRFGLRASAASAFAQHIDVRGDLRGSGFAQLPEWKGNVYAAISGGNFDALRQWVDLPYDLVPGRGDLRFWVAVDAREVKSLTADVDLRNLALTTAADLPTLKFSALAGRVAFKRSAAGMEIDARHALAQGSWGSIGPTDVKVDLADMQDGVPGRAAVAAGRVDLASAGALALALAPEPELRASIARLQARGLLDGLRLSWTRRDGKLAEYSIKTGFQGLGMEADGRVPGFARLAGKIDADQKGGTLQLDTRKATLDFPRVFAQSTVALDRLLLRLNWDAKDGALQFNLTQAEFANHDAAGSASGRYRWTGTGKGDIDLQARLQRADGASVWRYMPLVVSADVRDWLQAAIPEGRASDAVLHLKGDLDKFPFRGSRDGVFRVTAKVDDARLIYAAGWPEIRSIKGGLLFEGERMLIHAQSAKLFGAALSEVSAEIKDLEAASSVLLVKGRAAGPTAEFFRFIALSPVSERIDRFTEDMQASGNGALNLALTLPLDKIDKSGVKGNFQFAGNRITVDTALPVLTDAAGMVEFTEASLSIRGAHAKLLGMPISLAAATRGDGTVAVNVQGTADIAILRRQLPEANLLEHLAGSTAWRAQFGVRGKNAEIVIDSNLVGISSRLPEPFAKAAADSLALRVERSEVLDAGRRDSRLMPLPRESWKLSLGRIASAHMLRRHEKDAYVFERAGVGIGAAAELPDKGLAVSVAAPRIDVDTWRALQAKAQGTGAASGITVDSLSLKAAVVTGFGNTLNDVVLKLSKREGAWSGDVASKEASGRFVWHEQGKGRFEARFKQLVLSPADQGKEKPAPDTVRELPGIDLEVDDLRLRGRALGSLQLLADNRGGEWLVEKIVLQQPDANFTGSGKWTPQGATQVRFRLESSDVGKMLERIGYANVVARGTATLDGRLGWQGSPLAIDYPSMQGALRLDAAKGQFAKINPGAGRLLGILSLQSLPRRITLDFRDIFSEGLAFDTIGGDLDVARGVITTKNLAINAPAAKISITGQADLAQETQNLLVRVQPALSGSVAMGALLANPAVGVAAYLAQKVLSDPLDQIFAYKYSVTGAWADPKVERFASQPDAAAGAKAEEAAKR
ncbi:MAG: TIGR02099 family protein [Rhodocyclaceae bacterium]|nr:TIGR02099 family protein [Rhodocyclaceae bacterium]